MRNQAGAIVDDDESGTVDLKLAPRNLGEGNRVDADGAAGSNGTRIVVTDRVPVKS